jgi:hypothetical protein
MGAQLACLATALGYICICTLHQLLTLLPLHCFSNFDAAGVQVPAAVVLEAMAAYVAAADDFALFTSCCLFYHCRGATILLLLYMCRCLLLWCLRPWLRTWQQQMP